MNFSGKVQAAIDSGATTVPECYQHGVAAGEPSERWVVQLEDGLRAVIESSHHIGGPNGWPALVSRGNRIYAYIHDDEDGPVIVLNTVRWAPTDTEFGRLTRPHHYDATTRSWPPDPFSDRRPHSGRWFQRCRWTIRRR